MNSVYQLTRCVSRFLVAKHASSRASLAPTATLSREIVHFAGHGRATNLQPPDATKPALGGFCLASYLVGRGNLN